MTFPSKIIALICVTVLLLLIWSSYNELLLIGAAGTLSLISYFTVEKNPVFFVILFFQWLQVSTKTIYASLLNVPIDELSEFGSTELGSATILGLTALCLLTITLASLFKVREEPSSVSLNVKKLLLVYSLLFALELFTRSYSLLPGFSQFFIKVSSLRWCVVFLLVYQYYKSDNKAVYLVILLEFMTGLFSYFSSFKNIFIVLLISLLILRAKFFRINIKALFFIALLSSLFILTWQSIKEDYRSFLSGGANIQAVTTSYNESIDKAFELVSTTEIFSEEVIEKTINRMSYIDLFAHALKYVPEAEPHTNGRIWYGSLLHILQPRLFFPHKANIDDSEKTMKYTGLHLAGAEQGTSISLGYVAESYVDFGPIFLLIPVTLLGFFLSFLFRQLFKQNIHQIHMWALTVPFYFQFYAFEMASEKVLGATLFYFLVVFLLLRFGSKGLKWLEDGKFPANINS